MSFMAMPGFPLYAVRDDGKILSLRKGRYLKPLKVPNGYRHVVLCGEVQKRLAIHTVVATAWHGLPRPGQVVNHKDGDKTNNSADNLEWVTPSENAKHAYRTGLRTIS